MKRLLLVSLLTACGEPYVNSPQHAWSEYRTDRLSESCQQTERFEVHGREKCDCIVRGLRTIYSEDEFIRSRRNDPKSNEVTLSCIRYYNFP